MPRAKKNKQAGAAFKELLKEKGFSNSKLAKAIGMGAGHIGRIASGEIASPTPATLEKIAVALGVELGELTMIFAQSPMRSHSPEVPQSQEQEEAVSKNTDFLGREDDIERLTTLMITRNVKVIGIYAKGGIGKTTLARQFFKKQGLETWKIEFPIQSQDITSVEKEIKYFLEPEFKDEPEPDFGIMLQQVKKKLQAKKIGVIIDNLEPALDDKGKFIQEHRRYVELLRILADPDVQSITLITSRERLNESKVSVEAYKLPGLDEAAWQDFFRSHNIDTNSPAFMEMQHAYGGNAKAMEILCGVISQEPYEGDLEAYWQENKGDLLIERELEDLVSSQFNRLEKTDPDAYKLLYRLGVYRYQEIAQVPSVALVCLLWDVAEERRKRVINSLQNRFLVESQKGEFWKVEYWLHPVIRAEAVTRLKLSGESIDDLLESRKQQVDRILASEGNDNLQMFLQWVHEKPVPCDPCFRPKPAAVRAFYMARVLDFDFDFHRHDTFLLACSIAEPCSVDTCSISKPCHIHKALSKCSIYKAISEDIYGIRTQMYQLTIEKNLADSLNLLRFSVRDLRNEGKLARMLAYDMYWKLFDLLKHLRNQLPQEEDKLFEWWEIKGSDWTDKLKSAIKEYLNIGHNLQFSNAQKKLLKQYYDANQLLMVCLNSDCEVSDKTRSHIEDTLLLPIAEIKKLTPQD